MENDENDSDFEVKVSPIKFTVEKDNVEYEFEPIGEINDLEKLKNEIIEIMKNFNISIKAKNIVVVKRPLEGRESRKSFEEFYLKAKEQIREWYREDPNKEWSSNELMIMVKFDRQQRSSIMNKLIKEKFIICVNPLTSRSLRRYKKAEAMVTPSAIEKRDFKKLEEERRLVRDG